jgi:hypothetical protein
MTATRPTNTRRGGRLCDPVNPADCLSLAATPTFAIMALLSAFAGGPMTKLYGLGPFAPVSPMTLMYLLMAFFIRRRCCGGFAAFEKPARIKTAHTLRLYQRGATHERKLE